MADKPPPPQQGYPPQQQYPPPQQGYPPPQNPPPQQGYPPQQYPPPQGGYPPQQGYPPPSGTSPQQVPMTQVVIRDPQNRADDHLVFAVLVTIFCCWPVGIVAIIKSLNVRSLNDREDYTSAQQASQEARKWCIITLVCGIVLEVIAFIFVILHFTVFAVTATVSTKTTIDYVNNAFDDFDQDHQGHDWDLPESDNFPGDSFWG